MPGDAEALAGGIESVLNDPAGRQRLSEGALARRELFDWDRLVERVDTLYRASLRPRP